MCMLTNKVNQITNTLSQYMYKSWYTTCTCILSVGNVHYSFIRDSIAVYYYTVGEPLISGCGLHIDISVLYSFSFDVFSQ